MCLALQSCATLTIHGMPGHIYPMTIWVCTATDSTKMCWMLVPSFFWSALPDQTKRFLKRTQVVPIALTIFLVSDVNWLFIYINSSKHKVPTGSFILMMYPMQLCERFSCHLKGEQLQLLLVGSGACGGAWIWTHVTKQRIYCLAAALSVSRLCSMPGDRRFFLVSASQAESQKMNYKLLFCFEWTRSMNFFILFFC